MSDGYWLYPLSIGSGSESDLSWGRRDEKSNQVEGTCHGLAGKKSESESSLSQAGLGKEGNEEDSKDESIRDSHLVLSHVFIKGR